MLDTNTSKFFEFKPGDVFAYEIAGKYRVFGLINRVMLGPIQAAYCYAWERFYDTLPSLETLIGDHVIPLGYFTSDNIPKLDTQIYIGNLPDMQILSGVPPHLICEEWKPATLAIAKEQNLSENYPLNLCMKLRDATSIADKLRRNAINTQPQKTEKGDAEMFGFKKKATSLDKVLETLLKNEISIVPRKVRPGGSPYRSKFGGKPAVPADFEWPRFEADNYDGEVANRPLSFLCQIDLAEIASFDKESLLPEKGLLLFFYELESMRWGFDPADDGCSRVYYFENVSELEIAELPEDLEEEHRVKEYDLAFTAKASYPSYEELDLHSDIDCDWDDYDEILEDKGYEIDSERHKLLGYADLVQGEMLTECERIARGMYCGDAKSYQNTSAETKKDINETATDWILLFQMASIQDKDYELMFGDLGNIYFYIRKQDLKERNFENVWLSLQCG